MDSDFHLVFRGVLEKLIMLNMSRVSNPLIAPLAADRQVSPRC
jgi:hypothetical protein